LSGSLTSVRGGLNDLESSLEKYDSFYVTFNISYILESNRLRLKIRVPFQSLQAHVSCQQKLRQASDLLRRTSRFVVLARRLQVQMAGMNSSSTTKIDRESVIPTPMAGGHSQDIEDEKERTIAKAALSIAELGEFQHPL
jgi:conserved oligomeric Golgi complex subunit 5